MRRFELILIAVFLVILASALVLRLTFARPASTNIADFVTELSVATESERELVAKRYLTDFPASQLLAALQSADPLCHSEAHPVGRAVYTRTQNVSDSIAQCGTMCSDGCFHGALMQMFSTDSDSLGGVINEETPEAYLSRVQSVAKQLCSLPEVTSVILPAFCIHGLGHVFAYVASYDLTKAIALCESFQGDNRKPCISGMYMEYMALEKNKPLLSQKNFYPCGENEWSRYCFRFRGTSLISAWGSVEAAFGACQTLQRPQRSDCIAGIGFTMGTPALFATEEGPEVICSPLTGVDKEGCIRGAMMKVAISEPTASNAVCESMDDRHRALCIYMLEIDRGIRAE